MLDIKFIRENPEKVKRACEKKQVKVDIDLLLELDKQRRELIKEIEKRRALQNQFSRKIKELTPKEKKEKIEEMKKIVKEID